MRLKRTAGPRSCRASCGAPQYGHRGSQLPNRWARVAAVNPQEGMRFCNLSAQRDNTLWLGHDKEFGFDFFIPGETTMGFKRRRVVTQFPFWKDHPNCCVKGWSRGERRSREPFRRQVQWCRRERPAWCHSDLSKPPLVC